MSALDQPPPPPSPPPSTEDGNPLDGFATNLTRQIDARAINRVRGRVIEVVGTLVKVVVPQARIGEVCEFHGPNGGLLGLGEVVGFDGEAAILSLYGDLQGLSTDTYVTSTAASQTIAVSDQILGRVLDGMGRFLDKGPPLDLARCKTYPIYASAPNPLARRLIAKPLGLGLRALDGLLTCGEGQRIGIFAAAGVGKSTLMSSLVLGSDADICVVALIGERGREVREFLEEHLGEEGLRRAVLVVSTSDKSSLERARAAYVATAIAEYFRDQNKRVLLLMDSVTRFARALREIGLAAGEPPTRRGFPPSVFANLPRLLERTGQSARGSITAFYTVLVEGDDLTEPVADETRSILDGHVVLARALAEAGHYPAIDVLQSVSRVMGQVVSDSHRAAAQRVRQLLAAYKDAQLLIKIGEYQSGSSEETDKAIAAHDELTQFLRQNLGERSPYAQTVARLEALAQTYAA